MIAVWKTLVLCGSLAWAQAPPVDETPVPATERQIEAWIDDLDDREFVVREQATRALAEAGAPAIEALERAARDGSLETSVRAIAILSEIYGQEQPASVDDAEGTLERLVESARGSVARRADHALNAHQGLRERRAVARIQKAGGRVVWQNTDNTFIGNPDPQMATKLNIAHVVVGTNWKAGDEGLALLTKLQSWQENPRVYLVDGANVSPEALETLEGAIPGISIERRGSAYLGMSCIGPPNPCQVVIVSPNTAAARAGLRPDDVVTEFDGTPVPHFERLIELLKEKKAGDTITLKVERFDGSRDVKVTLGNWEDSF